MKKTIAIIIASAFILPAAAQYEEQGLLFSQTFPSMTARSLSMGGAFSSLGGDLSTAYLNPAGLGMFRKSEITLSPGIEFVKTKTDYQNDKGEDFRTSFLFGNAGFVNAYTTKKTKGLVGVSFALAYNRLNDFYRNVDMHGINPSNSLADYFMDQAKGIHPDNLINQGYYGERLAFDAYVIDTVPGSPTTYSTPVFLPVTQDRTIETTGGLNEWSLGFAMNLSNILYFGMGLGVDYLNYNKTLVHSEYDDANLSEFNSFNYTETTNLDGVAVNFKCGFIVRPIPILRISGALHTPLYFNMNENYAYYMNASYNGFIPYVEPIYGAFEYKLVTPLRVLGGMSVQIGKMGLVAADVEYIDYSNIRYKNKYDGYDMTWINDYFNEDYKPVVNFKAGGEVRFGFFSLRAGGGYYPSTSSSDKMFEKSDHLEFTGGIGFREKVFYMDMGFSTLMHDETYNLYYSNMADIKTNRYRLITTFGCRF
jgi:hypothetical protein